MVNLRCVVLWVIFLAVVWAEERPTISIKDGSLRGTFRTSYHGRKYVAFEGIPYAQPPIQELRFKDPQPVIPWEGTLDATVRYKCVQINMRDITVIGEEDCLYLNVYVPADKFKSNEKLNVIVHIHGGAFMIGDPNDMGGPSKLMDRDLVYVSFNYRLGPFGFYSTGDSTLPGNYGLKDQVFVLQWVQKNIEEFGGNPDSVTITGISSGGACVHLHYFSPLSEGLFHRGWAASGAALNPWVIKTDPLVNAKILAKEVGCEITDTEALVQCLQERPAHQIQNAVKRTYNDWLLPLTPFGPTVEPSAPSSFLTMHPHAHLASKNIVTDVPFMVTTTTDEGLFPSLFYFNRLDQLNERYDFFYPLILEYHKYSKNTQEEVTEKISEHYFDYEPVSVANFKSFVKLCTQRLFHNGVEKAVKLHGAASASNAYFIVMGVGGTIPGLESLGIPHAADALFYYDVVIPNGAALTDQEVEMKNILLDSLFAFTENGKPVIKDIRVESISKDGGLKYLLVNGADDIEMKSDSLGATEFWDPLGLDN